MVIRSHRLIPFERLSFLIPLLVQEQGRISWFCPPKFATMAARRDWKEEGNRLYRTNDLERAIEAYNRALAESRTSDILSNMSQALLKSRRYQDARKAAEEAIRIDENHPNRSKTRFRWATALYELRLYKAALQVLLPEEGNPNIEIQNLLSRLRLCVNESQCGKYDFLEIRREYGKTPRPNHVDYCSPLIELRKSEFGGRRKQGIFAKTTIQQGALIVASKAIASSYFDGLEGLGKLSLPKRWLREAEVLGVSILGKELFDWKYSKQEEERKIESGLNSRGCATRSCGRERSRSKY